MENTYKISVENNIINVSYLKAQRDPQEHIHEARLIVDSIKRIINFEHEKKYSILVDLINLKKKESIPGRARQIYAELAKNDQIEKFGFLGVSLILKVVARFILAGSGKNEKLNFFNKKEDALKWLNNGG